MDITRLTVIEWQPDKGDNMRELDNRRDAGKNELRHMPFFSELSPDETELVEQLIYKKRFQKNRIVLAEEETSQYMYFIFSGKVRIVKKNEDGREQIIAIHKKGDYFGEMSLLDGKTSHATVIAHEDAVIGLMHKMDFEYHLMNHKRISRKFIGLLCHRLRDAWKMIKILSFNNAEHRVMVALDSLRELYGVKDARGIIINIKLTHRMIANYASVARETATRSLKKLVNAGDIIILENRSLLLRDSFFRKMNEISGNTQMIAAN